MGFVSRHSGAQSPQIHVPLESLVLPNQFVGLEFEIEDPAKNISNSLFVSKRDGSLRNGIEYVSNGPQVGANIIKSVDVFFQGKDWFKVSPRTGLHVHIDMSQEEDTRQKITNLLLTYFTVEDLFFAFAGEERRFTGFSYPIEEAENYVEKIAAFANSPGEVSDNSFYSELISINRYFAFNLNSLHRHGTIEFRHMPMVKDGNVVKMWIDLIFCLKRFSYSFDSVEALVDRLLYTSPNDLLNQMVSYSSYDFSKYIEAVDPSRVKDKANYVAAVVEKNWSTYSGNTGRDNFATSNPLFNVKPKQVKTRKTTTGTPKKRATKPKTQAESTATPLRRDDVLTVMTGNLDAVREEASPRPWNSVSVDEWFTALPPPSPLPRRLDRRYTAEQIRDWASSVVAYNTPWPRSLLGRGAYVNVFEVLVAYGNRLNATGVPMENWHTYDPSFS